jgi:glutamate synthase (NADPH/NADH) small chain
MSSHILEEAQRCLNCKNPACSRGCPVMTPIRDVIKMLLEGEILKAGEVLFENNPLSVICSLVCPHERQCEGHCVRGVKGTPVQISNIENYISSYYLNFIKNDSKKDSNKKVAIVGSGPAGITIAIILASKGYDITIFEAHDKIGGVLRYGIPEFRLPKSILDNLKSILINMGIKIRPNTLIGSAIKIENLIRDGYKAIFIGTGVWKPKTLGIKGESLGHVHYAIDYLKNPDIYDLGDRVCIIGAGNAAMDVARTALRNGSKEVYIMYRGNIGNITADKSEVKYAQLEGIKFEFCKSPVEIVDDGIKYIETDIVKDESGNEKVIINNSSEELFKADSVIISISQGAKDDIISNTQGISVDKNGLIAVDDYGRTTLEGIFASGDIVTGAKTVVEAVRLSKQVAQAIDEYVVNKCNY